MDIKCDVCGCDNVVVTVGREFFHVGSGGSGGDLVQLSALVNVNSCGGCGMMWTNSDAEIARSNAVSELRSGVSDG